MKDIATLLLILAIGMFVGWKAGTRSQTPITIAAQCGPDAEETHDWESLIKAAQ